MINTQAPKTTLSPEDGVKGLTGLWGRQFTLDDTALLGSGGADVAADLFGGICIPTVATPEPAAEPAAALEKSNLGEAGTDSGTLTSNSQIPKPRSKGHKAAAAATVSPILSTIRKKPISRPHGVPSTTPRASNVAMELNSSDDELPTGDAGDHAWEDPDGAFASDGDSDEDLDAPARPTKSRKAPAGKRAVPRSRALARTLTPREKEMRKQKHDDERAKRDEMRKKHDQEEEYNRFTEKCKALQSCRGKALDMLDGMIPLGLGAAPTHFRRQNVATRAGAAPHVAVPAALDVNVRSYLDKPNEPEAAERAPGAILHDRVLALQRATSAPGAIGILEMRRTLKDPKWLPYERQRDMKNTVSTEGMDKGIDKESRREHRREHRMLLANQAAAFARAASEQREARLMAARAAFAATECECEAVAVATLRSPLGVAC